MPNRLLKKEGLTDKARETLVTGVEISGLMLSPDENIRKVAFYSRMKVLAEHGDEFADITNRLAKNKANEDVERSFATPLASRSLANQVEDEVIDALVKTVRSEYSTIHRYHRLKAKLLGKDKLDLWDINAPVPLAPDRKIPWQEAKMTILGALRGFSPEMAAIAEEYFDKGWIDAEPRAGKKGGAFCEAPCKSSPPALMLNYQGTPNDLITLAHELGHGIHMHMLQQRNSQLLVNVDKGPLTLAEVPSTFVEEIVFQALLRHAKTDDEKMNLLVNKIDRQSSLIMRQTAFHVFESNLHDTARKGEELTADTLGNMWFAAMRESYGPHVKMDKSFKSQWAQIPHFIHTPFYVHAYAFASLMSANLYTQGQRQDMENFPEKIVDLYKDIPIKQHSQLMAPFGLDARDPAFWQQGMDLFKEYVDEFQVLMDKKQSQGKADASRRQRSISEGKARQ